MAKRQDDDGWNAARRRALHGSCDLPAKSPAWEAWLRIKGTIINPVNGGAFRYRDMQAVEEALKHE